MSGQTAVRRRNLTDAALSTSTNLDMLNQRRCLRISQNQQRAVLSELLRVATRMRRFCPHDLPASARGRQLQAVLGEGKFNVLFRGE
jgi:hypothetical protein